jgi:nucleoside 2-deoxyribosyltransferase
MKQAYLSIGYQNRQQLQQEVDTIKQVLADFQTGIFVFVDEYRFEVHEEKQMMQQAFREIDAADLLIAEVSEKGIGVGIEIGYAAAKGKPVIYLRNASSEHSTTAAGSASHVIIYKNTADLVEKLTAILSITPF